MKRSITPLHCGSPTYDGVIVIPSHLTSLIHASAMYCGPQPQRIGVDPPMKTRCQGDSSHPPRGVMDRSESWCVRLIPCVVTSRPFGVELAPHFVTERLTPHGFLSSRPTGWTGS